MQQNNFYIITGGPGVGKTTLLNELQARGYKCIREAARNIIKQQIDTGGDALPWKDTRKYSDLMLLHSIRDFNRASGTTETVFFDRGIPDTYGYERLIGLRASPELLNAVDEYRYNLMVFILPPWKEIYENDDERKQDFEEAIATFEMMKTIYSELGYLLIEVPLLPVDERCDFVLGQIKNQQST
ncbi:AAA family ATPase [Dysgonomonas sp. 511]|uniref:AAA family ATPase n=1 Tax=Dysgonomonas sp. 511 TaxID=2302930 RepID=UPI0013D6EFB6|nr:AAA family ATPase [Dysgonomonas sp. 511]NDV79475.1 ATPase [Dysgonomonas sp. 511]